MITKIVSGRDLNAHAMALCQTFARGPLEAHGAVKRLLLGTFQHTLRQHLSCEEAEIAVAAATPDGIEGVRAFVGKRAPVFS
jgi:2-(1,2-epoxy-1,2-dihydrophenyl)acetyl-CoA isomerase